VIEDLGSLNGTYVNNERVGIATLKHGDQVTIASMWLSSRMKGTQATAPQQKPAHPPQRWKPPWCLTPNTHKT